MPIEKTLLWLGSPETVEQHYKVLRTVEEQVVMPSALASAYERDDEEEEEGGSYLVQREGPVAIVNIKGGLTDTDSFWNEFFGMVSYPEISRAMVELEQDEEITHVLLNIDSPGGSVTGLSEASETIAKLAEVKPVWAHTSSGMFSAGYWLGSTAHRISASKSAEVGSIGVLMTHVSYSRALKEDGIDVTVIRSGDEKALGHPAEPLSDKAKAKFQERGDKLYGFFLDHVAQHRPALSVTTKDAWAEGKTFFAQEALGMGLVDSVMTLTEAFEAITEEANKASTTDNEDNHMSKKQQVVLSAAARAKVASGVPLAQVQQEEAEQAQEVPEVAAAPEAPEAVEALESSETPETPQPVVEASETPETPQPAADNTVATLLAEMRTLNGELADAKADAKSAAARADAAEADVVSLLPIACDSVHRMQIAMGGKPTSLEGLPAATVVSQYNQARKDFEAAFPTAAKSRPHSPEENGSEATALQRGAALGIIPLRK